MLDQRIMRDSEKTFEVGSFEESTPGPADGSDKPYDKISAHSKSRFRKRLWDYLIHCQRTFVCSPHQLVVCSTLYEMANIFSVLNMNNSITYSVTNGVLYHFIQFGRHRDP